MEHISDADDSHGEPRRGNVKESGQKRRRKTEMDEEQMEEEIIKRKRHNGNDNRLA